MVLCYDVIMYISILKAQFLHSGLCIIEAAVEKHVYIPNYGLLLLTSDQINCPCFWQGQIWISIKVDAEEEDHARIYEPFALVFGQMKVSFVS